MQNGRHFKKLSHIELAPPQKIPAMLDKKRMCLALSAPHLLLLSCIAPPAQGSRCSCPKPLQPSQQGESLPLYRTDGESSPEKGRCDCYYIFHLKNIILVKGHMG